MILIGKLQERHLSHFQWLSEFRVTCHSSVWVLSVWPIFLLLHCVIFCSTRSKPMTKAISCHSCGSQVMVLRSQIPLSSRKTVKLAECSSISANIRSNLIFQPPLEKWTVNSIIVCSKTQQCSWLQAMPLLGQLSFMLGNKIQLSLRVPVCVHIALQSSTHPARKCQDCFPYCICLSCVYPDASKTPCKGTWKVLHNSCSSQLLFFERERSQPACVLWMSSFLFFSSPLLNLFVFIYGVTEKLMLKGIWKSSSPTCSRNWATLGQHSDVICFHQISRGFCK